MGYDRDLTMSVDSGSGTSDPPMPARIGGKYLPRRYIARGGMGTVYEVEHAHTGDRWALKVLHGNARLDAQSLERFRREARVSTVVKSPHVVRVMDADVASELDGAPFLVMELLEGDNLADATKRAPQPPEVVVRWLQQVARALDKAHALGIVHRDLKPENLFLVKGAEQDAAIKVLDFGIAKVRESEESNKTASGAVVGTPLYMAPEQATGDSTKIGPATDVWALGLIAYRLLTGRDYWAGTNVAHLLAQIVYEPLESPSARGATLPKAFDAWFARSCDRDPEKRFTTAGDQIAELEESLAAQDGAPITGTTETALAPPDARPRRGRDPWLIVGIAGVAAAAIAVVFSFGDHGSAPARAASSSTSTATTNAGPAPPRAAPSEAASWTAASTMSSPSAAPSATSTASLPSATAGARPIGVPPTANPTRPHEPATATPSSPRPKASLDPLEDQH